MGGEGELPAVIPSPTPDSQHSPTRRTLSVAIATLVSGAAGFAFVAVILPVNKHSGLAPNGVARFADCDQDSAAFVGLCMAASSILLLSATILFVIHRHQTFLLAKFFAALTLLGIVSKLPECHWEAERSAEHCSDE